MTICTDHFIVGSSLTLAPACVLDWNGRVQRIPLDVTDILKADVMFMNATPTREQC
jgi:hypothetical protein